MASSMDPNKLFTVNGMVAVITGGGTGIGLMMAKALALNGAAKVYILGRRLEKLQEATKESPHGNIIPIVCDVASKDSLAAAAAQVEKESKFVNLLVCNSGKMGPSMAGLNSTANPTLKQFKDYTWAWDMQDFTDTYHVNNTAVFFTTLAFLELLDAGNKSDVMPGVQSQIISTASIGSYLRTIVSGYAYATSKAAVISMTKAMATQFAPYGIRCNALAPGLFPSELSQSLIAITAKPDENGVQRVARNLIPAERTGDEEDMGGTLLYLASKAGSYVNGKVSSSTEFKPLESAD